MAKSKKSGRSTPPRRLMEETLKASNLLQKGKAAEAVEILRELDQGYPNTPEVLGLLVNAYSDLKDALEYEHSIRKLIRLEPRDPDLNYGLAGAYLSNGRPALALRAFQEALRRWPSDPNAALARKEIPKIEAFLKEHTASLNLPESQAFDLLVLHDELRYNLAHGELRQGLQVGEKLLHRFPNFVPALNNLVQIFAMDGKLDRAIHTSLRILDFEPDNIHALSNLARLYFLIGHPAEAVQYAQRLKDSQSDATNRWTKIAEALTFLEDDQGVLSLLDRARDAGELDPPFTDEIFYHLLAAASYFRGNEKDARKFWQKALKISPNFTWAQNNLDDLKNPENDRSGAWAYPLENWLLSASVSDLSAQMGKLKHAENKSNFQDTLSHYIEEKHPEVFYLAPHMVARGDAGARDFVVRMAAITAHPALVSAAKDFIFGKRGTFQERFDASHILSEADLLPSGPVQMWSDGEMREVMLLNIMIDPEPEPSKLPQRVRELAEKAWKALRDQNGQEAQELLEQALAIWPNDPSLLNNLAMALEMQGQGNKARQLIREVHVRFPDYFFGIIGIAGLEVLQGNLDHAHELLNDLIQRKKLHTSEFTALCQAQIQVYLAESNRKFARAWLEAWEQVDPEHPRLETYRKRIGKDRKK